MWKFIGEMRRISAVAPRNVLEFRAHQYLVAAHREVAMSDATFFAQILAAPDDRPLQHAYADWLEERGDPRGEFVRLQAELAVEEDTVRRNRQSRLRDLLDELAPLPNVLIDLAAFTGPGYGLYDMTSTLAELYNAFPLARTTDGLIVAIGTRDDPSRDLRDLERLLGRRVIPVLADNNQVATYVANAVGTMEPDGDGRFDVTDSMENEGYG
jgi:uncharacterized protein (TIGR02996 family)